MEGRLKEPRVRSVQPMPQRRPHPTIAGTAMEFTGRSIRLPIGAWDDAEAGEVMSVTITSRGWEKTVRTPRNWDSKPSSLAEVLELLPGWQATIVALHIEMENDLDAGIERAVRRMLDLERERERTVKPALLKRAKRVLRG